MLQKKLTLSMGHCKRFTTNGHVTNNATITICNELWDTFVGATNNYTVSRESILLQGKWLF